MNPKESEIKRSIREYLQWRKWFVFHIHQSMGSYPGIADLIACKNGRILFIEVKTQKGKQSRKQKIFQDNLECQGIPYLLARSIEDVERYLS